MESRRGGKLQLCNSARIQNFWVGGDFRYIFWVVKRDFWYLFWGGERDFLGEKAKRVPVGTLKGAKGLWPEVKFLDLWSGNWG